MVHLSSFSLKGRLALVTGASSGIGPVLAKGLAKAGAKVVVSARRQDRLERLVAAINAEGGKALAVPMDVTDRDSVIAAYVEAESKFGQLVDIVVNNAGVGQAKTFLKVEEEDLNFIMDANFKGVFYVAQEGARRLVKGNTPGSIINISSILGTSGKKAHSIYCASKAAVINMTRSMAIDLTKDNIRVNAIAPGWFSTELTSEYFESEHGKSFLKSTPAGDAGNIQDLVGPVIFLASDASAFVNGVVLPVDGAHTATWI